MEIPIPLSTTFLNTGATSLIHATFLGKYTFTSNWNPSGWKKEIENKDKTTSYVRTNFSYQGLSNAKIFTIWKLAFSYINTDKVPFKLNKETVKLATGVSLSTLDSNSRSNS
jgi:hypothetical protein